MAFWLAAIALALAAAVWVARPLALSRETARPRAAHDEQVFRDQLAEIDRDLDRGVLNPDEARAAKIEVSRRLLGAAAERERTADHQPAPRRASRALAAAVMLLSPALAAALYAGLGAPGLPDQPAASRAETRPSQTYAEAVIGAPSDAAADPELVRLVAELEARMAEAPEPQGLFLLARTQSRMGRHADSWRSWDRLIEAGRADAPAGVFAAKGEAMTLAAGGYVSPEAEAAFDEALARDPSNPVARYYIGSAYAQTARAPQALAAWEGLIGDSAADDPWVAPAREQIARLVEEARLGDRGAASTVLQADAEQAEMIRGMVEGLRGRLAADGGDAETWARLIRALGVLGDVEGASDAYAQAMRAHGSDSVARSFLTEQAVTAGVRIQ